MLLYDVPGNAVDPVRVGAERGGTAAVAREDDKHEQTSFTAAVVYCCIIY